MSICTWPVMSRPYLAWPHFPYKRRNCSVGGSKNGASAIVSCMGHLTSRFGKVSPHGRVKGSEMSSSALLSVFMMAAIELRGDWETVCREPYNGRIRTYIDPLHTK